MDIALFTKTGPESDETLLLPFGKVPDEHLDYNDYWYTLLNIPGQRYTIGPVYPDELPESEEFLLYSYTNQEPKDQDPICSITVDERGQFWIESCKKVSQKESNLFVNERSVEVGEKALLKIGDRISIRNPQVFKGRSVLQHFRGLLLLISSKPDALFEVKVLQKIFRHLDFRELKKCRLVSKQWEEQTRSLLESRGVVYLCLCGSWTYAHPKYSLLIFRFLHGVHRLNLKRLYLSIPSSTEPAEHRLYPEGRSSPFNHNVDRDPSSVLKMFDDLKKLVKHCETKFSCLELRFTVESDIDVLILSMLLSDLKVGEMVYRTWTKFPLTFNNVLDLSTSRCHESLQIFRHEDLGGNFNEIDEISKRKWAHFWTPFLQKVKALFLEGKETFSLYFPSVSMPNLRELYLKHVCISQLNLHNFGAGMNLEVLRVSEPASNDRVTNDETLNPSGFQDFVHSIANNLKKLELELPWNLICTFVLPKFPKLEELSLNCHRNVVINWGQNEGIINYKEFFPELKVLKILPKAYEKEWEQMCSRGGMYVEEWVEFDWVNGMNLFHSFFPQMPILCYTVTVLCNPNCYRNHRRDEEMPLSLRRRLKDVAIMFPNVKDEEWGKIRNFQG